MAFDVYYTRNPLLDAVLALAAGNAESRRQNDLIESQRKYEFNTRLGQNVAAGVNQGLQFGFNRILQGDRLDAQQQAQTQELGARDALERFRQGAISERQQGAIEADMLNRYGVSDPQQLLDMFPNAATFGEAAALNNVRRSYAASQYDRELQQVMGQANLEYTYQPPTIKEIGRIQDGLQRAMRDSSLTADQKNAAINKAREDLMMVNRPTIGPRRTPPSIQEIFQSGQAMVPPGFDSLLTRDAKGNINSKALHPKVPQFQSPDQVQQWINAHTTTDAKGNVWGVDDKGLPKLLLAGEKNKGAGGGLSPIPPLDEKQRMKLMEQARQNAAMKHMNLDANTPPTPPTSEEVSQEFNALLEQHDQAEMAYIQHRAKPGQDKLNAGQWLADDEWVPGATYEVATDQGLFRITMMGRDQNGRPILDRELVGAKPIYQYQPPAPGQPFTFPGTPTEPNRVNSINTSP